MGGEGEREERRGGGITFRRIPFATLKVAPECADLCKDRNACRFR